MKKFARRSILALMAAIPVCRGTEMPNCFTDEVEAHVQEQFRIHGPLSEKREYFGFIYRLNGEIASAVVAGPICRWSESCEVNSGRAASKIPKGAKVLGEWHTHPHLSGSESLSAEDVRGANANRHIRCYRTFFSTADGHILTWDIEATTVSKAMATSRRLGNYRSTEEGSRLIASGPP